MPDATDSPVATKSLFATAQPWLVCFSAALFFFFEFVQVNMFNALDPALIRSFHIDAVELGHLSASYFYANVLFLIPAGLILDRVSTRKLITLAMFGSVTCTLLIAFVTAVWQAEVLRFITGACASFCLLGNVRLASRWFPPKRMALVMGLIVTFAMSGGMVAQMPFTILVDQLGWRHTLLIDAAMGFVMLAWIFTFLKDYPPGKEQFFKNEAKQLETLGFWPAFRQALGNLQNWLGGIYTSLMNLPIFLLGAVWGSMYLVQVRHLTRDEASLVTTMLFLGTILGSPAMGAISDFMRRRRRPMVVGAVLSLLIILMIMYMPDLTLWPLMLLFFALGFITSTQIISYPLIAESNPAILTGEAEGIASTLIMAGGFMQPIFGRLMDWHWAHKIVNQLPVYSAHDFRTALAIMPFGFAVAFLASLLMKETHCQTFKTQEKIERAELVLQRLEKADA